MRSFAVVVVAFALLGCAKAPLDPTLDRPVSLASGSFEEVTSRLSSTGAVWAWLRENTVYTKNYGPKDPSDPDLIRRKARVLFESRGGTCGYFAAFFTYCAKKQGKRCGLVSSEDKECCLAHHYGFVIESNGLVSWSSNNKVWPEDATVEEFAQKFDSLDYNIYFYDENQNRIGNFVTWAKEETK